MNTVIVKKILFLTDLTSSIKVKQVNEYIHIGSQCGGVIIVFADGHPFLSNKS